MYRENFFKLAKVREDIFLSGDYSSASHTAPKYQA